VTDGRPQAPFGRRSIEVVGARWVGAYRVFDVVDPVAPVARAGQFHMLTADGDWGGGIDERPWLPRAISFLDCDLEGRFSFLIDPVGPGTEALCRLEAGDSVLMAGPFGNGFPAPDREIREVLVGGGIGVAPILARAIELERSGVDCGLILGFRTSAHAEVGLAATSARLMTDDGSAGDRGDVLGPLREALDSSPAARVSACGPPAMLDAVRSEAAGRGNACLLALESPMACGFGACFGCAVETCDGIVRLCVDGPVLDGAVLQGSVNGQG